MGGAVNGPASWAVCGPERNRRQESERTARAASATEAATAASATEAAAPAEATSSAPKGSGGEAAAVAGIATGED